MKYQGFERSLRFEENEEGISELRAVVNASHSTGDTCHTVDALTGC